MIDRALEASRGTYDCSSNPGGKRRKKEMTLATFRTGDTNEILGVRSGATWGRKERKRKALVISFVTL